MTPQELLQQYSSVSDAGINLAGFSLANSIFRHRQFEEALAQIARMHIRRIKYGAGGGAIINGRSGVGKTTLLRTYEKNFPFVKEGNNLTKSVLFLELPGSATASGLLTEILNKLGYPPLRNHDIPQRTIQVANIMKMFKVELLLIDEMQHGYYSRTLQDFRLFVDTLKTILNRAGVTCIAAGLSVAAQVIDSNEELARRVPVRIELKNFSLEAATDFEEFRAILKAFQNELPIPPETPLYDANMARRFLIATDGILDYVGRILSVSVEKAGSVGSRELTLDIYASAFRNQVWGKVPDRLNPFHPESALVKLNRPGEPFDPWEIRHQIGSPVARRNLDKPNGGHDV